MKHILRPLDRYVLIEFSKIFVVTALGFPILLIVIDLTDHVQGYLERQLQTGQRVGREQRLEHPAMQAREIVLLGKLPSAELIERLGDQTGREMRCSRDHGSALLSPVHLHEVTSSCKRYSDHIRSTRPL